MNKYIEMNNGLPVPSIGFGTWQTPDGDTAANAVKYAIESGYRHIDTAAVYGNEQGVGRGIRESRIDRRELFVTSKVWNTERGYDSTLRAFDKTLNDLQLDYLDLYLIHWPAVAGQFENWRQINADTWRAMEKLQAEGKIRAIGVSNFLPHHLKALMGDASVVPAVNQIEFHPGFMQTGCVECCKAHGILVEAWSPLGTGRMLGNETLKGIAGKYHVSVAQLCIRWVLQNGVLPLPKSVTPVRIRENLDVFGFEISEDDMQVTNRMECCGGSGLNPDKIDF